MCHQLIGFIYNLNDQANGYGELKFANGDIYKGEFKNEQY